MGKIKNAIPNLFTFSNLGCGILSLMMSSIGTENYSLAAIFIVAAALFDRYDGRIARKLNVDGPLGKELDSLADIISFGVAPAVLIFNMTSLSQFGIIGYCILLIFPIAGAYRLAKYNITDFEGVFKGIPITIAGMLLSIYAMFLLVIKVDVAPSVTVILVLLLSYLMNSNLQLKKV
ncbi:MAG: CDP-diacylglycerol--serine O-phosphatidyltransferase [Clostridium sp.]